MNTGKQDTLVICSSRGRPQRFEEFYTSFKENTSGRSSFVLRLDDDDPKCKDYVIKDDVDIIVKERQGLVANINQIFWENPDYKYYSFLSDDAVIRTKNWEDSLIEIIEKNGGWGYASANDLIKNGKHLLSFGILSANIPKRLGYIFNPIFKHLWSDTWMTELLNELKMAFFAPDTIIEHKHWAHGKSERDQTYNEVQATWWQGRRAYKSWQQQGKAEEVKKLWQKQ